MVIIEILDVIFTIISIVRPIIIFGLIIAIVIKVTSSSGKTKYGNQNGYNTNQYNQPYNMNQNGYNNQSYNMNQNGYNVNQPYNMNQNGYNTNQRKLTFLYSYCYVENSQKANSIHSC